MTWIEVVKILIIQGIIGLGLFMFVMVNALLLTLGERKILGWMQQRLGPIEVGPWGLLQPLADMIKLVSKGDLIPRAADKFFYSYSSIIAFVPAFVVFAFFPYGVVAGIKLIPADSEVGILMISAVMAVSVIGVILGGWSSGNKFSLLGAVRSAAQELSYEIPKTLSILAIVMLAGSMNMSKIADSQRIWFIIPQLLGFGIFFIASLAEVFRIPFDLAEGESELVSGYNVEFAGIRFAFFFFAEYTYLFVTGALVTTLFLGGGSGLEFLPWGLSSVFWFMAKSFLIVGVILWLSRSLPRVRADQLMNMAWKVLLPLSLINLLYTAFFILSPTLMAIFVQTPK